MKNIFILVIVGIIGYFVWNSFSDSKRQLEPITQLPYIYYYSHSNTGLIPDILTNQLEVMQIKYVYKNIKKEENLKELMRRMEDAGMSTKRFDTPIVDVNGYLIKSPEVKGLKDLGKFMNKVNAWANNIIEIYNDH